MDSPLLVPFFFFPFNAYSTFLYLFYSQVVLFPDPSQPTMTNPSLLWVSRSVGLRLTREYEAGETGSQPSVVGPILPSWGLNKELMNSEHSPGDDRGKHTKLTKLNQKAKPWKLHPLLHSLRMRKLKLSEEKWLSMTTKNGAETGLLTPQPVFSLSWHLLLFPQKIYFLNLSS